MYLMNPDLAFGRDRMRDRLHRAEIDRMVREAGRRDQPVQQMGAADRSSQPAAVECGPCPEALAA
jgi:hypothetical protein